MHFTQDKHKNEVLNAIAKLKNKDIMDL
jgi:hypothetical protein